MKPTFFARHVGSLSADKKPCPEWVKSLFERVTPQVYKVGGLKYIGMPVGGLCLPIEGDTWSKRRWGYQGTKNIEDLTLGYEKLLKKGSKTLAVHTHPVSRGKYIDLAIIAD